MKTRIGLTVLVFFALGLSRVQTQSRTSFPPRLERYMTDTVKLTAIERQRVMSGDAITRMLPADESKEVAILGAVWINAPMRRYLDAVTDIESFETGAGFKVTKKISAPPKLEDFRSLR